MRVKKALQPDQDLILRFIGVLGSGLQVAAHSKFAKPAFFVNAGRFIGGYLEPVYFQKEEVLLKALEDCGFPSDVGPVGNMRAGQAKSSEISRMLIGAADHWQNGDEAGRGDVVWATSEYTGLIRSHLELLKNLIYPLLEQTISAEDEQELSAQVNRLEFGEPSPALREKYLKIIEAMEEELSDWR